MSNLDDDLQLELFREALDVPETGGGGEETPEVTVSYEDFNFEDLMLYAGIDCIATSGLLAKKMPELLTEEGILDVRADGSKFPSYAPPIIKSYLELEVPAHEFLIDLEINGMGYSVERNRLTSKRMVEEIGDLDNRIWTAIGKKVDMNSGQAMARFLYEEQGFTPPAITKGGEPATDGSALMILAGLDPMGGKYVAKDPKLQYLADMAKRKDINSVHNTFVKTYVEDFVKRDGRIHPSYNQFGTSSFRITGSDPNLTQLPREKHGYNVRTCYTVRPGYVFISFDFSSAEVKVLANMAKEPAMLRAIADGLDFHTFSASAMAGIPYEVMAAVLSEQSHHLYKEYKNKRQQAKVLL